MASDETLHILAHETAQSQEAVYGIAVTPFIHAPGAFPMLKLRGDSALLELLKQLGLPETTAQGLLVEVKREHSMSRFHFSFPDELLQRLKLR